MTSLKIFIFVLKHMYFIVFNFIKLLAYLFIY